MEAFVAGTVVRLRDGRPLKIVKPLAEGGSAQLYSIELEGRPCVLKWYKASVIQKPNELYRSIEAKVCAGSPSDSFAWPIELTDQIDGSFGFVMDCVDPSCRPLSDYLCGQCSFSSYKAMVEVCIRIVQAFTSLHRCGLCFQAFDDGCILINPETCSILICDSDYIAPNNVDAFVLGTPRYMAPELVAPEILGTDSDGKVRSVRPSTSTDYWSLSVVLFMILCMGHPLEGERWIVPLLTPQNERFLYGSGATFVYDPDDDSNRPNPKAHANVVNRWKPLPPYMKDAFLRAFGKDAVRNPGRRLREVDWMKVLVRFQAEIRRCHKCGGEVFMVDAKNTPCDVCGELQSVERRLRFRDYAVTASKGVRVYRCMLESCNAKDALTRVGTIVSNPSRPGLYFLNNTDMTLEGRTAGGVAKLIPPNSVVPLRPGIIVKGFSGSFVIE